MYDLLGALAFAMLISGYVLAVVFIRHDDDGTDEQPAVRHEEGNRLPPVSAPPASARRS